MPKVGDVYRLITCQPKIVREDAPFSAVVEAMTTGSPVGRSVYVVDAEGRLKGIVGLVDVLKGVAVRQGIPLNGNSFKSPFKLLQYSAAARAGDLMRPPLSVTVEVSFQAAMEKMVARSVTELPVVDAEGRVIGDLNAFELLRFM